jgi:hypothetical protein
MTIQALYPDISPSLSLDFANVKQLDPRVTFARASTARYYDGKTVAKAEENLLIRSQEFGNAAWLLTSMTQTSGVTAPDGTSTAFTLNEGTAASATHSLHQVPSLSVSTTYTFSCFIKNVDAGFAGLTINTAASNYGTVEFDLSGSGSVNRTAALGTGFSIVASSITAVGNSWFRCVATIALGSASISDPRATVYMSDGSGSFDNRGRVIYTGTSKTIEAWGAQLEQRSEVTAYTATTTQPITNYIPVLLSAANNEARFDHNPTTSESLGLLIEEQRTNLFTRSEEFDDAAWTKARASIIANTIVAPDGTLTGAKLVENTANDTHRLAQSFSWVSGTTYTISLYAKHAGRNFLFRTDTVAFPSFSNAVFNLTTGTVSFSGDITNATITNVGNGWYRCTATATANTTTTGARIFIDLIDSSNSRSYQGDGYSGIYIWGAQLEAGAFPTSYIPTVASQVTRSVDAASMTGTNFSSWYRQDEGALYAEWQKFAPSTFQAVAIASNGTSSNVVAIGHGSISGANNNMRFDVTEGGVSQASITTITNSPSNTFAKTAAAYAVNDFSVVSNGGSAGTDTSGVLPVVNRLSIGANAAGTGTFLNGTLRKLAYYPKRLTNAQLQALTT